MEQNGKVVNVSGKMAVVQFMQECSGCNRCGICNDNPRQYTVYNEAGAKEGDSVVVETKSGSFLGVSFLMYIMPVFGILIGFSVFQYVGALMGALLPIAGIVVLNKYLPDKSLGRITQIVDHYHR